MSSDMGFVVFPVIIFGDFNIRVDRDNDVHAAHLADVLQLFDYVQHVTGPTHKLGHTLDIVITRADTDVSDVRPRPLHTALSQVN